MLKDALFILSLFLNPFIGSTSPTTNNSDPGPIYCRFLYSPSISDANESNYSTGLQEDWDPTHPKFNVDALIDPDAFVEGGKVRSFTLVNI